MALQVLNFEYYRKINLKLKHFQYMDTLTRRRRTGLGFKFNWTPNLTMREIEPGTVNFRSINFLSIYNVYQVHGTTQFIESNSGNNLNTKNNYIKQSFLFQKHF